MSPAAARPSARNRSVAVVFILALVLLGIFALGRLPVDLPPSSDAPRLNIRIAAPGLTAPVIEKNFTLPLETVLAGIPNVASIASVTFSGSVSLDLFLIHRGDIDAAQQDVMSRLERVRASWPTSIDPPSITLIDNSSAILELNLTSKAHDSLALRDWAETELARRLRELSGVAMVDITGGTVREILVMPDQRRLAGYGLSFEDLLQVIRKNPEVDSRVSRLPVKKRSRREPVLSGSLAAMAAVPVVLPDGESIRLSEVSGLVLNEPANPAPMRVNGVEAVKVTVHKQTQAALSDVVERVRAHVDWMRANRLIPEGIEIPSVSGRLDEARQPLKKMAYAFLIGFILVLSAAQLQGGRARRTLILGVITVASLQGVFIAMALSGTALDVMALGSLVLGTGLFGSSVMLMFEEAARPAQVSVNGISPVIVAFIVLVAALLPVWFAGDELSALYRGFVAVFSTAWLLAALLAWWLVPMFDTRRRGRKTKWNTPIRHAMARMRHGYDGMLRRLLQRAVPGLVVAAVTMAAAGSVLVAKILEAPAQKVSSGHELSLRIQGPEYTRLLTLADDIVRRLESLPELHQARHSGQTVREELMLRLDEDRARDTGVDMVMAGKALAIATTGIPAGSFRDADHHYNVRVQLPPEDSSAVATGKILLLGELEDRPAVHLRDVATLERIVVPTQILHRNGEPVIEVFVRVASEWSLEEGRKKAKATLEGLKFPSGYRFFFGQQLEIMPENRGLMTLGVSVLLIMFAATGFYRSLRLGLLVTLAAGVTLVGTGAIVLSFGMALTSPVRLGALLLLGIAAGHASALVSRCEASSRDLPLLRRLKQAARNQFDPIMIMVLTAILGMVSLMWVNGSAAVLHTLIIVLVSGLMVSLLVNLLLTPLLYWVFARKEQIPPPPRL